MLYSSASKSRRFVICDKKDYTVLGVIELDDTSHLRLDRIARDRFVDVALSDAGIPILHHPVKENHSVTRLQEDLREALGLDFEPVDAHSQVDECLPFTDEGADSEWRAPRFKL